MRIGKYRMIENGFCQVLVHALKMVVDANLYLV